jgi:acyl-CoA thioesterase I
VTGRVRVLLLFVWLATAAGCGNAPAGDASNQRQAPPAAAPAARPATERPRIVALGDSLTAGLGLSQTEAYPALLQKRIDAAGLGFEVVNAGVSGDTSAGGVRRLDWVLTDNTRVLILALGANDELRGLPVEQMKENLETVIERARARQISVILAGMEAPPNFGPEYTSAFRQAFRDLAREHGVVFVPFLLDRVAGQSQLNQGDGIHPNAQGAEILAGTVWAALEPMLTRMRAAS